MQCHAESEVAAQGKTDHKEGPIAGKLRGVANCRDRFFYQGPVEEPFVQVVTFSVIPQVEPEDITSPLEEVLPRVKDIGGIRASFPSMDNQDQCLSSSIGTAGVVPEQPNAIASVDDHLIGVVDHLVSAQCPQVKTCEDTLDMRISRPWAGVEAIPGLFFSSLICGAI